MTTRCRTREAFEDVAADLPRSRCAVYNAPRLRSALWESNSVADKADRALELLSNRLGTPRCVFRDGQENAIRHVVEGRGRLLVVQKNRLGQEFSSTSSPPNCCVKEATARAADLAACSP